MESGLALLSRKEVEGTSVPWWWGATYRKILTAEVVYHIIPFNIVVRWGRDFLFWIRKGADRSYKDKLENEIFRFAFQRGQNNIRSRILVQVANNLVAQGMPRENAKAVAEHVLRNHLGI